MMLGILKIISIPFIAWYSLPGFVVEASRNIRTDWQSGLRSQAVLGTSTVCLCAFFVLAIVIALWELGERTIEGERIYKPQHWSSLFSVAPLYLFLLLSPEIGLMQHTFSSRIHNGSIIGLVISSFAILKALKKKGKKNRESVYGLQHGKLHLDVQVPMWMNMGYWKVNDKDELRPKTLAEACRSLLNLVLAEAELTKSSATTTSRRLIDVGFGCGDQTIYLMSEKPLRHCDEFWWDAQGHQVYFDHYIGITNDQSQCLYAKDHVAELKNKWATGNNRSIALFCADAARPKLWGKDVLTVINITKSKSPETWLLALDTAYHFAPSRWILIEHARWNLDASFMAFDLCLSPHTTFIQKLLLYSLTTLMGAPWENFVTPEAYKQRLVEIGYPANAIKVVDISKHVFSPLAAYMDEQNSKLRILGLGLGNFQAARWLFRWWGSTGVVRGVVVVARHPEHPS